MSETTPLVIAIDSSQVEKGTKSLASLSEQGKATESSISKFTKATGEQKNALNDLLGKIDPTVASLGRLDDLQKELIKNKNKGFIDSDTFAQYNATIEKSRAGLSRFTDTQNATTKSSKEMAFALRGVPAQFTDIAVSLQGGQKPLTVLLQQGGQLKDMFGGIGPAARALGGYVAGLINPFTLAAAAVGALGYAYFAASERQNEFNKALITSGGFAGNSAGQLNSLADKVGALSGHYSDAREAVTQLAASGVISSKQLEAATKGVVDGVTLTGEKVQDLVKDYILLSKDPVKGLLQLNEKTNFLTASVYEQVKALQDQGKTQEAVTLATKTYQEVVSSRTGAVLQNLGLIERGWLAIKTATSGALNAALNVGAPKTNADLLADAKDRLKKSQGAPSLTFGGNTNFVDTGLIKAEIARRQADEDIAAAVAKAKGITAEKNQANLKAKIFTDTENKNPANFNKNAQRQLAIDAINLKYAPSLKTYEGDTVKTNALKKLRDQAIANLNEKAEAGASRKSITRGESDAARAAKAAQNASNKELNGFDALAKSIKEKNAQYNAALLTNDKLAASDANQIKLNQLLAESTGALAKGLKAKQVADIQSAIAIERGNEALSAQKLFNEQVTASLEKSLQSTQALADKEQDRVDALQREIDIFGLSEKAVSDLEAAKLNDAAASYEQAIALVRVNGGTEEQITFIYAQIDAIKARATAIAQFGAKTAQLDGLKEAKKANDELVKESEKTADDINKSLTDALLRGFESGKGFARNFRDTLKNMFKSLVLTPAINFILKSTGLTGLLSGGAGGITSLFSGSASAAGAASTGGSLLSSLTSGGGGILKSLLGGTAGQLTGLDNLVQSFSNVIGNAGFPKLASSLFNYSGAISKALPFAGAAFSLLKGDVKGAAIQGIGTALGSFTPLGPIGGAIASALLSGLFGSREKGKGDRTNGSFSNGVFTSLREYSGDKGGSLGAGASLTAVSKSLTEALGGYLKNFGLNPNIQTDLSFGSKKGNSHTDLSGNIDGAAFSTYLKGDFQAGVANVLTVGFVNALKASKLSSGLKSLFDGISDKTQIDSLISSTIELQSSQKDLASRYNLTVDAAARVAKASGLAGAGLTDLVSKLAFVAKSGKTIGANFVASRDVLETQLNKVYGDIVTTSVSRQVSTQVAIANQQKRSGSFFGLGGFGNGGNTGFGRNNGSSGGGFFGNAIPQFKTVITTVTDFIDTLVSKSLKLPASLDDYDARLKNINTTTKAGAKQFADIFALRDQFAAFSDNLDGLKGGVKGATFGLRTPQEQAALLSEELNGIFKKLGVTVPKTAKDLLNIGDSIEFTTKSGIDLAAAFPDLVSAFDKTKSSIDAITESVLRADTSFATLVDQQRYEGVSKNYNTQFSADYTSNLEAGRIVNGRNINTGASNEELINEVKMLRAGIETIAISNSRLVKYEVKKDIIAGGI